jgi:hypothetical protein
MILKVRNPHKKEGWHLWTGVKHPSYSKEVEISKFFGDSHPQYAPNCLQIELPSFVGQDGGYCISSCFSACGSPNDEGILVTFGTIDGESHEVYTNCETYLCDDRGETIERIN